MPDIPIPEVPGPARQEEAGGWQRLQSLLALVIAVVAITLAAWEGLENRRHNRLTVQPRLGGEYSSGREGDSEYVRIAVENNGLGPAVIGSLRIFLDDTALPARSGIGRSPWSVVIDSVATEGMHVDAHAFGAGYFLPAGREYLLFQARRPRGSAPDDAPIGAIADRIGIDICYCSIYGSHCDRVTLATKPLDVGPCPDPPEPAAPRRDGQ
ncbi:MAG TPA: hypothetical protein VFZ24_03665 [Longimicrobiales bacterium]